MIARFTTPSPTVNPVRSLGSNYSTKRSSFTALLLDGKKTVVLPIVKSEQLALPFGESSAQGSQSEHVAIPL